MAFAPINKQVKVHSGGGGIGGVIGKIAGTGIGAILGTVVGGPAGAVEGASLGYSLGGLGGGLAGNAIDPAKVRQTRPLSPLGSMSKKDPQVQMAMLQNAQAALKSNVEIPKPESEAIMNHLQAAKDELKTRLT